MKNLVVYIKSDLVIIAGRPSMGKTAGYKYSLPRSEKIFLKNEKSSVAFSLEMSSEQLSTKNFIRTIKNKSNDIRRVERQRNNLIDLLKPKYIRFAFISMKLLLSQYQL